MARRSGAGGPGGAPSLSFEAALAAAAAAGEGAARVLADAWLAHRDALALAPAAAVARSARAAADRLELEETDLARAHADAAREVAGALADGDPAAPVRCIPASVLGRRLARVRATSSLRERARALPPDGGAGEPRLARALATVLWHAALGGTDDREALEAAIGGAPPGEADRESPAAQACDAARLAVRVWLLGTLRRSGRALLAEVRSVAAEVAPPTARRSRSGVRARLERSADALAVWLRAEAEEDDEGMTRVERPAEHEARAAVAALRAAAVPALGGVPARTAELEEILAIAARLDRPAAIRAAASRSAAPGAAAAARFSGGRASPLAAGEALAIEALPDQAIAVRLQNDGTIAVHLAVFALDPGGDNSAALPPRACLGPGEVATVPLRAATAGSADVVVAAFARPVERAELLAGDVEDWLDLDLAWLAAVRIEVHGA